MIKGWSNINLKTKLKSDLENKLLELDKLPWKSLSEEEKELRNKIVSVLDNPEGDSESVVISSPDTINSERSFSKQSSSVEDTLDVLGNIVIVLECS